MRREGVPLIYPSGALQITTAIDVTNLKLIGVQILGLATRLGHSSSSRAIEVITRQCRFGANVLERTSSSLIEFDERLPTDQSLDGLV